MIKHLIIPVIMLFGASSLDALTFTIKENDDIVGATQKAVIQKGENIYQISRRFGMGLFEVLEANPGLNQNKLQVGQEIIIPSAFILPPGPREGIVLNLAELRLRSEER